METLRAYDADGNEVSIPARFEVCDHCRGRGHHDHPAFSNGITQSDREDWADDDFMEEYMRGTYDVRCEECNGNRVVLVPDEFLATPEQIKVWEDNEREEWEYRAMVEAERRMGA